MTKISNRVTKKDTPRRVFNSTDDIFQFEEELFLDSLSQEEKDRLGLNFVESDSKTKKQSVRWNESNLYYWPEKDTFVHKGDNGVEDLIKNKAVIPQLEYIRQEMTKRAKSLKVGDAMMFPLPPIIFKNKGKTPPSVPYLKVAVVSSLEEDTTSLHRLHSKTRPTIK